MAKTTKPAPFKAGKMAKGAAVSVKPAGKAGKSMKPAFGGMKPGKAKGC